MSSHKKISKWIQNNPCDFNFFVIAFLEACLWFECCKNCRNTEIHIPKLLRKGFSEASEYVNRFQGRKFFLLDQSEQSWADKIGSGSQSGHKICSILHAYGAGHVNKLAHSPRVLQIRDHLGHHCPHADPEEKQQKFVKDQCCMGDIRN